MDVKQITTFLSRSITNKVKQAQSLADMDASTAANYLAQSVDLERKAGEYKDAAKAYEQKVVKDLAEVEKVKESVKKELEDAKEKAELAYKRLKKHKGIADVIVTPKYVEIITPLIWVNIRKAAGSRESVRTCIGAYKFTLIFSTGGEVRVENLVFERHWAVSEVNPCFGEYQDEIRRMMQKNQLYELWDMLYQWLIGADRDAAAYMLSHDWKRNYRKIRGISPIFQVGQWVVYTDDSDGRPLKGCVGMVTLIDPNRTLSRGGGTIPEISYRVTLKQVPGNESRDWYSSGNVLKAISQKKFKEADRYKVVVQGSIAQKLDRMQSGTLEDYQKLLNDKERIQILPYEA